MMNDETGLHSGHNEIDIQLFMKNIRQEARQKFKGGDPPLHINPLLPEKENPLGETCHVRDFAALNGREFVCRAYQAILGRAPDESGLALFLGRLESGRMTKEEVLFWIRYSREGRMQKTAIKGLWAPFLLQAAFKIPVIGYVLRFFCGLLMLPVLFRRVQALDARLHARMEELAAQGEEVKANSQEIIRQSKGEIESTIQQSKGELETAFRKKFDDILVKKADRSELQADLATKIDHAALTDLLGQKADIQDLHLKADRHGLDLIQSRHADLAREMEALCQNITDHRRTLLDQERRLTLFLEEARKRLPGPFDAAQMETFTGETDHVLDALYLSFEDQFRGTRTDIKNRLKVYLPLLPEQAAGTRILDIGCGRGEWLELLAENSYPAQGLDLNHRMVEECREHGFRAEEGDAVGYLKNLAPASLDVVTGFHVVEHLSFRHLVALFDECRRVLKPQGLVIFETPNPENILVGACFFHADFTHRNPLFPDSLRFLLESRGFVKTDLLRLHDYADFYKVTDRDDPFKNKWFYSAMDYAVIGKKC